MKRSTRLFPIACLFFMAAAYAQPVHQWEWALRGGGTQSFFNGSSDSFAAFERVTHISSDGNGNNYFNAVYTGGSPDVAGQAVDHNALPDALLVSTDCDGNLRWVKAFGSSSSVVSTGLAVDTANNAVYATGEMNPRLNFGRLSYFDTDFIFPDNGLGRNDPGPHNNFAYLIKYDLAGNFQWVKFPQNGNQTSNEGQQFKNREVYVDAAGNVHWLLRVGPGTHLDGNLTVPAGASPFPWVVVRYDPQGNYVSHIPIDYNGSRSYLNLDFAFDSVLNRYYLLGRQEAGRTTMLDGQVITASAYLASIDAATGNTLWLEEASTDIDLVLFEMFIANDSSIYLVGGGSNTGGTPSFAGYFPDQMASSGGTTQAQFVVALNPDGSLKWGNNADGFSFSALAVAANATTVAVGSGMNTGDSWDGVFGTSGTNMSEDPAVILLDAATGAVQQVIQPRGTSSERDEVTALGVDPNGNFIVGGYMRRELFLDPGGPATISSNGGNEGDFWLARLATTDCSGAPLSNSTAIPQTKIKLYPNPAGKRVWLEGLAHNATVTIRDLNGRTVLTTTYKDGEPIDLHNLATGVYIVTTGTAGNSVQTKLVVE
ncbi:MAG: T9SS type A sorting domain-containing protein [Nonlabens sp.]